MVTSIVPELTVLKIMLSIILKVDLWPAMLVNYQVFILKSLI